MANHKSAKKRIRQNVVRKTRNKSYMSQVKTFIRSLEEALVSKDQNKEAVSKAFVQAQSGIQKAVSKGLVHKNSGSRKISRLSQRVKLSQAAS